jgi:hypothetical protein
MGIEKYCFQIEPEKGHKQEVKEKILKNQLLNEENIKMK